jgi:coatomer protein complex subunit alpha (xenin)
MKLSSVSILTILLKARKLLAQVERNATNEVELDYNQHNPFTICAASFTPIYRGSPSISCPYCQASYKPEFTGQLCNVCDLAAVGSNGTGLRCTNETSR